MEGDRVLGAEAVKKIGQSDDAGKCKEVEDAGKKEKGQDLGFHQDLKHEIHQLRVQVRTLENQLTSSCQEILDKEVRGIQKIISSLNKNLNDSSFVYNQQLEQLKLENASLEREKSQLQRLLDEERSQKEIISYHLTNCQKMQETILENNAKMSRSLHLSETKFNDLLSSSEKEKARLTCDNQSLLLKYNTAQDQLSKNFSIKVKALEAELEICKVEYQRLLNLKDTPDFTVPTLYELELSKLEEINGSLMQENKELQSRFYDLSKLIQ